MAVTRQKVIMGEISTIKDSKDFYENRYAHGYMEEWSDDKKTRVYDVIKNLNLPDIGDALDFGCGNGICTSVLKRALPGWNIFGCDISEIAIKNATERISNCKFFVNGDMKYRNRKFDFVFTHHVLEHVFDIGTAVQQITEWANNDSSMLHICPCGNRGSFEYRICDLRIDGINKEMENRFFFEDEGHRRRMTTEGMRRLWSTHDFYITNAYYGNQFLGAINWISKSDLEIILKMINPMKGKDIKSKLMLSAMAMVLLLLKILRMPNFLYDKLTRRIHSSRENDFWLALLSIFLFPVAISKLIDACLESLAEGEWRQSKSHESGSEMYLFFAKRQVLQQNCVGNPAQGVSIGE